MKKQTIPMEKAVEIAAEMHRAGQFERAQAMYVDILKQDPGNVDAIHLLGVLANQGGRPDVGVELIGRALSKRPDEPLIIANYADALAGTKQHERAIEHYQKAIELAPEFLDPITNLARLYVQLGRYEEAGKYAADVLTQAPDNTQALNIAGTAFRSMNMNAHAIPIYEKAIALDPNFAEAFNNLGLAMASVGRIDEGIEKIREAIRLQPSMVSLHVNLGVVYANASRHQDAINALETALKLDPKNLEARSNLSSVFRTVGRLDDSMEELDELKKEHPDYIPLHLNYAHTFKEIGRNTEALESIDRYIEKVPTDGGAKFFRAITLRDMARPDEAIDGLREALAITGENADILSTLGYALQERGELEEALDFLNRSIKLAANPQTHSNVMMVMCYTPNITPQEHYEAHRSFARAHEDPVKPFWKPFTNGRDPNRRLRIGYFSPDMRGHVVSYFSNPIFENHEHENFEIFAYSNNFRHDATTLLQRARFDHWRETAGMTLDAMAEMIRKDQIDILVELAGHTANNGLAVLARKPAPIQVNAIGFPSTTGLTSVDYRVTDRLCDPPGIAEAYNSEKLLYMPDCFWVYQPPFEEVPVAPLPADANGYVTFVSVNNFTKVTPQVLDTWARIVAATPNSKIVLQTSGLASEFVQNRVREIFASRGVSAERIDMRKLSPFVDYLKLITNCDIMLDPFPFNGGTTTCHGLWMGTPVITLEGQMHAGRMGLSMLNCIGLPELVAKDLVDYVRIASSLGQDLPRLREIRLTMRERLQASPLLDAARYVKHLESSYRQIWRQWCETGA